jgi:hypothetical protein
MTNKKELYEEPAMQIVVLQHQTQLLAGSEVGLSTLDELTDYPESGDPFGF